MHFWDERVRETMTPLGAGVFRLEGAAPGRQTFESAKRNDGLDTPVQSGDTTTATFVQKVGGATFAINAVAELTIAGTNTLTIDQNFIRMSTSGASIPAFNTEATGEAFCAFSVKDILGLVDPYTQEFTNKDVFRKNLISPSLADIIAELTMTDAEPIMALGAAAAGDLMAGAFVQDNAASGTDDGVDIATNPNAAGGKIKRVGMKVAPTSRGNLINAGTVLQILAAGDPQGQWRVTAWQDNDQDNILSGRIFGNATEPNIVDIVQTQTLSFDIDGINVRLRNGLGSNEQFSHTVERIG